jgi:phosphoglycolate phosphatase-like HAD superfamily hydrolase
LTAPGPTDRVGSMGTRILEFRFGLVDLEGVVFNLGILYRREFGRFLEHRYHIPAKEALRFYQADEGLPLQAKFARLLAERGHPVEEAARATAAFRQVAATSRPVVSEGARELLEILAARGTHLCALSETESRVAEGKLEEAELRSLFGQVIGTERAPRGREQIALCAKTVGLAVENFADQGFLLSGHPEDMAAAAEFGCYAIGAAHLSPEDVLKAHGAQEVYRHVAHLALLLRPR